MTVTVSRAVTLARYQGCPDHLLAALALHMTSIHSHYAAPPKEQSDLQVLVVKKQGASLPSEEVYQHGITAPMRNVRQEVFATHEPVEAAYLKQVSEQMLHICEVRQSCIIWPAMGLL